MSTNSDRRHLLAAMSLVVTANETTGSTPTMGRSRPIAKHQGLAEEASEVEFWRECHDRKKSAMRARTLGYTHSDMLRARPNPPPLFPLGTSAWRHGCFTVASPSPSQPSRWCSQFPCTSCEQSRQRRGCGMNVCVCSGGRSRDVRCRFSQGLDAHGGEINCPKACFIVKSLYDDHWQEHGHRRMGFDILIPDLDVGRCDQSIARRRSAERNHHQLSNFKLTRYV